MTTRARITDFQDRLADDVARDNLGAIPPARCQREELQRLQRDRGVPPVADGGPGNPQAGQPPSFRR